MTIQMVCELGDQLGFGIEKTDKDYRLYDKLDNCEESSYHTNDLDEIVNVMRAERHCQFIK